MNNTNILKVILVVLCLHLMYTNADLLIINSKIQEPINWFQTFLLGLFGLSYSILTAVAIYKIKDIKIIIPFAILDGFAVWLRMSHETQNFVLLSSLFYGLYTSYIVVISFVLSKQEQNEKQKQIEEQKQKQNELEKQIENQKQKTKQIKIVFDNLTEEEIQEVKSKTKALNRVKDKETYINEIENPKVKEIFLERYASNE